MATGMVTNRAIMRRGKRIAPLKPFDPFVRPPPNYYDPSIDAAEAGAQRGLKDLTSDISTSNQRGLNDYTLAKEQTNYQSGNQLADLHTSQAHGLEDLATQGQDFATRYQRAFEDQARQAQITANQQRQKLGQAGALDSGAVHASQVRRDASNALAVGRLGQDQARGQEALATNQSRLLAAGATNEGRIQYATDHALKQLGLGLSRNRQDNATKLTRAQRETAFLGVDAAAQRYYSAAGLNYQPPASVRAQSVSPSGQVYRAEKVGNRTLYRLPDGRLVKKVK